MPSVQELIESIETVAKSLKRAEINRIEAERVSLLPAPTVFCDPVAMLAEAKKEDLVTDETPEEKLARHREKLQNHQALLNLSSDHIKKIHPQPHQFCSYHGCRLVGALGHGTKGDGNFFCSTHWRMAG